MSSDNTVNHLITTGIGISVLAGIFSGVCYILALRRRGSNRRFHHKKNQDSCCRIDGNNFLIHSTGLNFFKKENLIICLKCGAKVCIEKCSKFGQQNAKCRNCLAPKKSWITDIFAAVQQNSDEMSIMDNTSRSASSSSSNTNLDFNCLQKLNKEQIRDFIERLVNVMLGENVDNASVSMMYNNRQYLQLFTSYHDDLINALTDLGSSLIISMSICIGLYYFEVLSDPPIIGQLQQQQPVQPPCTAHTTLKQLIQKLISEAVNLPLLETAQIHPASEDTEHRTYEDLLATAIINKAVNNYQQHLPNCSSTTSISSRVSSKYRDDKEYFFGEETLDSKWKTTDCDTTSVSSVEEWLQGECSSSNGRKYVDKTTLMIKQDIDDNSDSEDDAEYFRSNSSLLYESESNWLLQKKKFPGGHSPVPVPMLVPNPSIDVKVLIGDKPLDDTSDLSDIGSDLEELIQPSSSSSSHSIRHQKSKHLIDKEKSKNPNTNVIINANNDEQSESSSSTDSGVKEVNGEAPLESILKTDNSLDDDNLESSFISVYSNTEKEAEYTEKYASLNRQILDTSACSPKKSSDNSANSFQNAEKKDLDEEFIGGTYSKKEKEKWKHAVELKNNPYSTENIEKRFVQKSNSSAGSAFGPDYYARLAKKPSGGGEIHSHRQVNGVTWPPLSSLLSSTTPPPSVELLGSATEIYETPPELPKSSPPPKPIDLEIDGIHYALKAIVTPTEEEELEAKMSFTTETYSTDTEGSSYVNFYDVEHSQVVIKSKNENVHIPIKENGATIIENNNVALKSPMMRIVHSQSIEDNFDSSPKVLQQKKDNTLISKIYKDPKVRLFAKQSREDILSDDNIKKKNVDSSPSMNLVSKNNSENDTASESGRNGKISFSDYDGDLLSLSSVKISEVPHENNPPKSSKSFIYSSQEDLLSIDEFSSIPRRKDNTLITKIYQDPNVIKFAFKNHKDAVLDYEKATGNNSSLVDDIVETAALNKHQYSPNYKKSSSCEISSLESSQISIEEETEFKANNESLKINPEKQSIKKALGKLSINNNNIENPPLSRSTSIDKLKNIGVSVWNLRKQFENNDDSNNKPVISSLTARSLSKQVKEILKEKK